MEMSRSRQVFVAVVMLVAMAGQALGACALSPVGGEQQSQELEKCAKSVVSILKTAVMAGFGGVLEANKAGWWVARQDEDQVALVKEVARLIACVEFGDSLLEAYSTWRVKGKQGGVFSFRLEDIRPKYSRRMYRRLLLAEQAVLEKAGEEALKGMVPVYMAMSPVTPPRYLDYSVLRDLFGSSPSRPLNEVIETLLDEAYDKVLEKTATIPEEKKPVLEAMRQRHKQAASLLLRLVLSEGEGESEDQVTEREQVVQEMRKMLETDVSNCAELEQVPQDRPFRAKKAEALVMGPIYGKSSSQYEQRSVLTVGVDMYAWINPFVGAFPETAQENVRKCAYVLANTRVLFEHLAWGAVATTKRWGEAKTDMVVRFWELATQAAYVVPALVRKLYRQRWKQEGVDLVSVFVEEMPVLLDGYCRALADVQLQAAQLPAAERDSQVELGVHETVGNMVSDCREAVKKVNEAQGAREPWLMSMVAERLVVYRSRISQLRSAVTEERRVCTSLELDLASPGLVAAQEALEAAKKKVSNPEAARRLIVREAQLPAPIAAPHLVTVQKGTQVDRAPGVSAQEAPDVLNASSVSAQENLNGGEKEEMCMHWLLDMVTVAVFAVFVPYVMLIGVGILYLCIGTLWEEWKEWKEWQSFQ